MSGENVQPSRVGVIGIGLMGEPMARRLIGAGHQVIVTNRTRSKAEHLADLGAIVVDRPAEVAAETDHIVLALPSGDDVAAVLTDVLAEFGRGGLIIDTSTIAPHEARAHHQRCAAAGIDYVDAPVSGGTVAAEAGTLSIMAGGESSALDRAETLCAPLSARFVRCGAPGSGSVAKACNQLVVAATIEIVGEALVLAAACGVDPACVREALLGGFASSRILDLHGNRMLTRNFVPGGKARLQLKDIDIITGAAAAAGVPLVAFEAAAQRFRELVDGGGGELDHSAVVTVLEHVAGVGVGSPSIAVQPDERG